MYWKLELRIFIFFFFLLHQHAKWQAESLKHAWPIYEFIGHSLSLPWHVPTYITLVIYILYSLIYWLIRQPKLVHDLAISYSKRFTLQFNAVKIPLNLGLAMGFPRPAMPWCKSWTNSWQPVSPHRLHRKSQFTLPECDMPPINSRPTVLFIEINGIITFAVGETRVCFFSNIIYEYTVLTHLFFGQCIFMSAKPYTKQCVIKTK